MPDDWLVESAELPTEDHDESPPRVLVVGGLMLPLGAGVAFVAAVLAFGAGIGGANGLAAFFGALAVIAVLAAVAGIGLLACGSLWWVIHMRRTTAEWKLPKAIVSGLIAWTAAIVVGIAVSAGLGRLRFVGYGLMVASFSLWFIGAALLAIGSRSARTHSRQGPRRHLPST